MLGDEHCVAGGDDIAGDAEESGGGIDEAEVEAALGNLMEKSAHASEVRAHAAAGVIISRLAAGHERKCFEPRWHDQLLERESRIGKVVVETGQQS